MKFVCIFTLVFTGFLFGLHNLYWYYEPEVRAEVEIFKHKYNMLSEKANQSIVTKGGETFGT